MMAINHAVTGAIIGLSVDEPALALPLAFASHFVLDAIPHYDPPGSGHVEKITSRQFFWVQVAGGAGLCFLLVVLLAVAHPKHWLLAAICASIATLPDGLFVTRYLHILRTGKDNLNRHWFWRFHNRVQWRTGPRLIWLELVWLAATGGVLWHLI